MSERESAEQRKRDRERDSERAQRIIVHNPLALMYVEYRFTVFRDSINIKNIICCVYARMNAIILLKLNCAD